MTMHNRPEAIPLTLTVNGVQRSTSAPPAMRLSELLRESFGLTGTKVGCDAGDCGACTVSLDGRQVCACLVPAAQADGSAIVTVEGLADTAIGRRLQAAFHAHGAAQCGICTPGMLMAAADLLARTPEPTRAEAMDALGGVLCRCTGYEKIVDAIVASGTPSPDIAEPGAAVGARLAKLDGLSRLDGTALYGADAAPEGALWLRAIRSPHARARFRFGDLDAWAAARPGIAAVLTARDVPGHNSFGVYPTSRTSPSSPRARCATAARPWPRSSARRRRWTPSPSRIFLWSGRRRSRRSALTLASRPIRRCTRSGPTMC